MFVILAILCFISAIVSLVSFFRQGGTTNFFAMLTSLVSGIAFIRIAIMQDEIKKNKKETENLEKISLKNRQLIEELNKGISNNYASLQELSKAVSITYSSNKELEKQVSDLQSNSDEENT